MIHKKILTCICSLAAVGLAIITPVANATQLFGDPFTYPDGTTLVGTSGWVQQGTSVVNPVRVTGGVTTLANNGQDINGMFGQTLTPSDGSSIYLTFTINVSAAQATGDYFLGTNTTGGSTLNSDRVYIQSSGAGFLLGAVGGTATLTAANYGTTVLNLNTSYQVVLKQTFVTGTTNDTLTLYINPTDRSIEGNNTAYANLAYGSTAAEATSFGAILLRQGSTTAAPTLTVDNVGAATTFVEAAAATQPLFFTAPAAVPEPATYAYILGAFGTMALILRRRMA